MHTVSYQRSSVAERCRITAQQKHTNAHDGENGHVRLTLKGTRHYYDYYDETCSPCFSESHEGKTIPEARGTSVLTTWYSTAVF